MDPKPLRERLEEFVAYRRNHLTGDEKGEAQVFLDRLFIAFGHEGVKEARATLEHRVAKRAAGGTAFADLVWRPRLLLEMKKAGQRLERHYQQAFEYWIDLVPNRPQYVVLCNFDEFWIYDLNQQLDDPVDRVALDDLPRRWEALAFMLPRPQTPVFGNDLVEVTREAAATIVRVTNALIERGIEREDAQRFTMQSVMAMFAEDTGLLPTHSYTAAIEESTDGGSAYDLIFGLFREMNTPGITAGGRYAGTPYFNGGLYRHVKPFDLETEELVALHHGAGFDWATVRPEIFGTLFEQSLGKAERHAYGAHFTSGADIQRIVLPTIVRPWRERIDGATTLEEVSRLEHELLQFRVLDPACGCGNFLYIAYRELRRLEKRLMERRQSLGRGRTRSAVQLAFVHPTQFFGMDINPFAVEIAKVTLMLGRQLAADELGDEQEVLPLDDLDDNFITGDALFTDWPEFDACIGNPPYLGRRRLIEERGADYSARLAEAYPDVGGVSDYVVYWFRLAHDRLPAGGHAGLVGTNSIREVSSRKASLDYIVDNGGTIVDAWSSLDWSGDANLHVSIVNWRKGEFDGVPVLWLDEGERRVEMSEITGSLSTSLDLRRAFNLKANLRPKVFFQGQTVGHKGFVLSPYQAQLMAERDPASEAVLHPYIDGQELLRKGAPGRWVIDLAVNDAMQAEATAPVLHTWLAKHVLPDRQAQADKEAKRNAEALERNPKARVNWHHKGFLNRWWQQSFRREDLLAAIEGLDRYIITSRVASELRRPVFAFVRSNVRSSDAVQCFALDDDYSLGILHSSPHEAWFRGRCSTLEERLRYTSKTVFDTFPWPQEPSDSAVEAVVDVVESLLTFREERLRSGISLAKQYDSLRTPGNSRLRDLHDELDDAVLDVYGFDRESDLLQQLLDLNATLAAREAAGESIRGPGAQGLSGARRTHHAITAPPREPIRRERPRLYGVKPSDE